jgi:7-cyano-7-deazaguanine synthase
VSENSSIGVLVSGGLDSAVLLAESSKSYREVWPIYVRQGLVWENAELYWLRRFLRSLRRIVIPAKAGIQNKNRLGPDFRRGDGVKPLTILSLPMKDLYGSHWSTGFSAVPGARSKDEAVYLPGRNLILSLKPAVFAAMNKIPLLALGSLAHNPFADAEPAFFNRWGAALSLGLGFKIKVVAPYRHRSKAAVIQSGTGWPLHLSFSCISPKGMYHCGRCNKCAERRRAFKAARVEDKTIYATN